MTAPVVAALAAAIRLESPGSPIYRQTRVGLDGEPFAIYKLRTMVTRRRVHRRGAGDQSRATPGSRGSGAFLRRYSLDELPNLWNVLRGEMSIVGPRPTRPGPGRAVHRAPARPAERSSRGSPAGPRSTAARRCPGPSGSSSTSGTSSTARSRSTCEILARTVRMVLAGHGLYKGETGGWRSDVARPAHRRRQALRHRLGVRPARAPSSPPTPNPLAPAQYAAHHRRRGAADRRPGYVPALQELCERVQRRRGRAADRPRHRGARARARRRAAARVRPRRRRSPGPRSTSTRPTCCWSASACPRRRPCFPASRFRYFPVMVKPRQGSGARSIHPRRRRRRGRVHGRLHRRAGDGPEADGRPRDLDRPAVRSRAAAA